VLDQSERVQDKVEQAALDLSSVNANLKDDVAEGMPRVDVEIVLDQSEAVETKVEEAAEELIAVNEALALEIDERHRLEEQLAESTAALAVSRSKERRSRHSALHDAITGLPNLTLFNDRLTHGLAQAERHGWRLAVMFVDLDDFKVINDVHGHNVGDQVLLRVAQRLKAAVRTGDTISRRSGDEFLLLMLEAKDEPNVAAFATRIMQTVAESAEIGGVALTVTASIGIALYPEDGRSVKELLEHADAAMYVAKEHKAGPTFYRSAPR
jgi:diguanylate cyclase (GGDEF)-like protein